MKSNKINVEECVKQWKRKFCFLIASYIFCCHYLIFNSNSNEILFIHTLTLTFFVFIGVGKTSLVAKYISNIYSKEIAPTIGASFFTCKINLNETKVKMQIWDVSREWIFFILNIWEHMGNFRLLDKKDLKPWLPFTIETQMLHF